MERYASSTPEKTLPRGFAPRASAFAGRHAELLHLGSIWKMVAASGIAPDSPRLQRGANLSQLHSHLGGTLLYMTRARAVNPRRMIDKKEQTPLPTRLSSHPLDSFHGGSFGVSGTPPGA